MPYKYSGKNFNFGDKEEQVLLKTRTWCKNFFDGSDAVEKLLSKVPSTDSDKNLLCKVMKVFEDDDREIRIKDKEGKSWRIVVDKIKYPELNNSDIIRIKSAKTSSCDGVNILEMRPHTNILLFLKDSMIDKKLKKEITDTEIDRVIIDKEEPDGQLIITKDLRSYSNLKQISLLDLFFPKDYAEYKANNQAKEERKKTSYHDRGEELNYCRL
jgi:hypothetical protein